MMTDTPDNDQDRLDREAALWCARMHGDDAEQMRPEFDAWLREDPRNLLAYNGMEEMSLFGARLKAVFADQKAAPPASKARIRFGILVGCFLVISAVFLVAGLIQQNVRPSDTGPSLSSATDGGPAAFSSTERAVPAVLPDGSRLLLDPHSRLKVAFDADQRLLFLEHGGARFEVAHEARPFIVAAGGGSVTAKGTIFHVAISAERKIEVKLIRGRVDVELPHPLPTSGPAEGTRHMVPGDHLEFEAAPSAEVSDHAAPSSIPPASRTVGELVLAANATTSEGDRLVIDDADLAARRLSGAFRVHDPVTTASQLAAIFDLVIDRSRRGMIILRHPH